MIKDLWNIVNEYLLLIDIYNLGIVTSMNFDINNKAIKLIKDKLRDYDLGDDFLDVLNKSNAYISGSFILQSVLSENYYETDIDIFVKMKMPKRINNKFNFSEVGNYLWKRINQSFKLGSNENYTDINMMEILTVHSYKLPKIKVQIIYLNNALLQNLRWLNLIKILTWLN